MVKIHWRPRQLPSQTFIPTIRGACIGTCIMSQRLWIQWSRVSLKCINQYSNTVQNSQVVLYLLYNMSARGANFAAPRATFPTVFAAGLWATFFRKPSNFFNLLTFGGGVVAEAEGAFTLLWEATPTVLEINESKDKGSNILTCNGTRNSTCGGGGC